MNAPAPHTDAADALRAVNRRRRSIRRWVAIATLPLTLAGLLLVGKVLSMYAFAHQSITAYVIDDYAGAATAAEGQKLWNWFEPFAAPYNVGTALAGAEELELARAELEEAVPLAVGLQVCAVRINLAIVVEHQGDAALDDGDGPGAAQLYGEAMLITAETPDDCRSDEAQEQSPDPQRDMSDTLDGLEDRLKEKQEQSQQQNDPTQGEDTPQQQTPQDKLDELEQKLEQGAEERQQNQQGDEQAPGGGTDKPW